MSLSNLTVAFLISLYILAVPNFLSINYSSLVYSLFELYKNTITIPKIQHLNILVPTIWMYSYPSISIKKLPPIIIKQMFLTSLNFGKEPITITPKNKNIKYINPFNVSTYDLIKFWNTLTLSTVFEIASRTPLKLE